MKMTGTYSIVYSNPDYPHQKWMPLPPCTNSGDLPTSLLQHKLFTCWIPCQVQVCQTTTFYFPRHPRTISDTSVHDGGCIFWYYNGIPRDKQQPEIGIGEGLMVYLPSIFCKLLWAFGIIDACQNMSCVLWISM